MRSTDTIAAIATPPGRGGIGVLRLSGGDARAIALRVFRFSGIELAPRHAQFGRVVATESGEVIDEAVLTYFAAPHSYTGEDVVEISCHGSPVVLRRVLDLLLGEGARLAEPGEFTFRAFLNRKLDLAQAQAVRDLINAQTTYQARLASRQLEGALAARLAPLKQQLLTVIVHMESAVEFVEDDIAPENLARMDDQLARLLGELRELAATFAFARLVKEGFDLAIVGRPNVGKSSVFNRLIGAERAIVTEIAGTTRDTLYEAAAIAGVPVRLIDTAGIRDTADVVETLGIHRSRAAIADADIVLLVLDNSQPLAEDDRRLLSDIPAAHRLIALNKSDIGQLLESSDAAGALSEPQFGSLAGTTSDGAGVETAASKSDERGATDVIRISALTGEGFDLLRAQVFERLAGAAASEREDLLITDARQQQAIRQTIAHLEDARQLLATGEGEEVILLKLHAALTALGDITGETLTEDILGQIFSTFCIGK